MTFVKMKPLQFLFVAAISLLIFSCGNDTKESKAGTVSGFSKDDEKEILQLMAKQSTDWSAGNLEKFMEGYWKNDSLQFIKRRKILKGWQETMDNYKKTYTDSTATEMGKLQYEILKLNPISGDAAFMTGRFKLERGKRKNTGIFTLVFRKIDGRWVIVYDHTT
jgi:ketosteroid isomerase-like protein